MRILLPSLLGTLLAISVAGQGTTERGRIRFVALGQPVEVFAEDRDEASDFTKISIRMNGRIVKAFASNDFTFPQLIGSFRGIDEEYFLYRTSMGNGVCAGGTLFVIEFRENERGEFSFARVSPPLATCLGEFPVFAFTYNREAQIILDIAGHTINLGFLNKWIEKKKPVPVRKKR